MRLLTFVRTAIIILINVSACFGATSYTSREERMGSLNASEVAASTSIIPTRAKAIDGVHENNMSSSDSKNNEARGINPVAVHMVDPNVEKGEMIAKLSSDLKTELGLGTQASTGNIAKVLEHEHWAAMIKETDDWLLEQHVNPETVFSYMKLESIFDQDMDMVTMSHDPKLLLWFRYIIEYRKIDSAGSEYAVFDDKKLLEFLVEHLKARSLKLTLSVHDKPLPDPHLQAVTLVEAYRHEPSMESFAGDVLTYMITDSTTKSHVLNAWLQKEVSPKIIFDVLRLGDEHGRVDLDDMAVFTAWLNYVKMYMNLGAPDFNGGSIIRLQLSAMSTPRSKAMFESKALEHVLGDVKYKNGDLASFLREVWQVFPELMFRSSKLSGVKITRDNFPTFMTAITFVAAHMKTRPFDGARVYGLLTPANSLNEVDRAFKILKVEAEHSNVLTAIQRSDLMELADNMVQYCSASSLRLQLLQRKVKPENVWNFLLKKDVDTKIIKWWFTYSVSYYSRVTKLSIDKSFIIALYAVLRKIAIKEIPLNLWRTAMEEMRKEHASLWDSLKKTISQSRKRKREAEIQGRQPRLHPVPRLAHN